ncbi:MAG: hypothetical protein C0483_25435 [Pirellula sp.]|nr:hypothetical protein [Pirellula sp.]
MFWGVWSVVAAFGAYSCMYAFRKPFTAAAFDEVDFLGYAFKSVLITSQVAGYTISKFIGIKVVAEMPPSRRAAALLSLVGIAELALLAFAVVPPPWNAVCLFVNGLPLGMVFGLVLGFLEGRQSTEALAAGLCASFIVADGATKSLGAWLLQLGVSEYWMPCVAGSLMIAPLLLFVGMLTKIPPPGAADVAARSRRTPLDRAERRALALRYAGGLIPIVSLYLAMTILRSLRADFAPEIWRGLGEPAQPATFTYSELWVALGVVAANGLAMFIRDNRRAFFISLLICGFGAALLLGALALRRAGMLGGFEFMVAVGLGMYLPYVAIHTTVFERLIAMTRERGNLGFLMYLADSTGYLGYVAVMLIHGFLGSRQDFLGFFLTACGTVAVFGLGCVGFSWRYFAICCPTSAASIPGGER